MRKMTGCAAIRYAVEAVGALINSFEVVPGAVVRENPGTLSVITDGNGGVGTFVAVEISG